MTTEAGIPDLPEAFDGPEVLVFSEDATKGDIIYAISERIPTNEFGLPQFFIRSDLISGTHVSEDEIDAAAMGLFYHDGYPTLFSGSAFWNQLPHEPQQYFEYFQKFLDQAAEIGIRQLDLLAAHLGKHLYEISAIAKEFYWSSRARAYDMFIVAAEAKKRQHRIRNMENKHFMQADKLINELVARFQDDDDGDSWIEELTAKEALEALELLVKVQRLSVGLVGQQSSSTNREFVEGEGTESMIRKIASGAGASSQQSDKFAASLQKLLEGDDGLTIQAAVLKLTASNTSSTFNEGV